MGDETESASPLLIRCNLYRWANREMLFPEILQVGIQKSPDGLTRIRLNRGVSRFQYFPDRVHLGNE